MNIPVFPKPLRIALMIHAFLCLGLQGEDWSRFRGPNGSGVSNATGLPTEFGPDKNVMWKVDIGWPPIPQ